MAENATEFDSLTTSDSDFAPQSYWDDRVGGKNWSEWWDVEIVLCCF